MPPLAAALVRQPMDLDPAEETGWVLAARAGDEESILRLLTRYRPRVVRLLASVTGDPGAAEDVAQEAFLQAFRSLAQLRDPASFYPWVRRTAMRLALKAQRRREEALEENAEPLAPDPIRRAETRLAVQETLERLPPELRAALVLREMERLDYAEIAETLEIPVGTVRSRLFAARERFRTLWTEADREGSGK